MRDIVGLRWGPFYNIVLCFYLTPAQSDMLLTSLHSTRLFYRFLHFYNATMLPSLNSHSV